MDSGLIFDIGANRGQDAAFYLAKGFRVLAVDADPDLCDEIRRTQAPAVAAGRLNVVNVGVAGAAGELDFFVNEFSEWSSLRRGSKATQMLSHKVIRVPVVSLAVLVQQHGAPYYLKIDIEGSERDAIASLRGQTDLPAYLSFEVNPDWPAILELMEGLGYDAFQLVRQGQGILPPPPVPAREGAEVAIAFSNAHSGCFGRDLPGPWLDRPALETALAEARQAAEARVRAGQDYGWHDIHARHRSLG